MKVIDAPNAPRCDARVMADPAPHALVLRVERSGGDPIRGWLEFPDGTRERFEGLLSLLAALDAATVSSGTAR
jgi:hypothetical protein